MKKHAVSAVLAALLVHFTATAAVYYDGNFDSLTPGALNGQDGWAGSMSAGGTAPVVVTAPGTGHGQAVRLDVADLQGSSSAMDRDQPNLLNYGSIVTVSFDLFRVRDNYTCNLWWWWVDNGTPTYGLSWDQGSGVISVFPFGWDAAGYTADWWYNNWVNVKMTWDMTSGRAHFWLDGWDPGASADIAISGVSSLSGWHFNLGHDENTGSGPETAYVDNFRIEIVPEPAAAVLLGLGFAAVLIRRSR